MFDFRRQRVSPVVVVEPVSSKAVSSKAVSSRPVQRKPSSVSTGGPVSSRRGEGVATPRELPDVTGFLVVVLVTLGLFVVPVGATIMQGPAIVASILGR